MLFFLCQRQVQQYIRIKETTSSSTTTKPSEIACQSAPIEYYTIPVADDHIIFIDSVPSYERLLARLFQTDQEDLVIGFDCRFSAFQHYRPMYQ